MVEEKFIAVGSIEIKPFIVAGLRFECFAAIHGFPVGLDETIERHQIAAYIRRGADVKVDKGDCARA